MSPLNLAEILLVLVDRAITAVIQAWETGQHFLFLCCYAILLRQERPFYCDKRGHLFETRDAILFNKRGHLFETSDAILLK